MPTYDFYCGKCEKTYSLIISLSDYEKKQYCCPECENTELKQQITPFQTVTTKKS